MTSADVAHTSPNAAAAPGSRGPLRGVRVLEMAAIGPVPFCAMLLADLGADVLRIARPQQPDPNGPSPGAPRFDVTGRSRESLIVDIKQPDGVARIRSFARRADIFLEGSRPGVMERRALGPAELHALNPRLVYGRMTGWGQTGPLAHTAGHDINYIALTGVLHMIGSAGGPPVPPLNLVGDYGGGALFLALGVVCALLEARASGHGQVVDAAMTDGAASLISLFAGLVAGGNWTTERGANLLDGGAPWYGTYETADGRHVAVGALEEPFWQALLRGLGMDAGTVPSRAERANWPAIRALLDAAFRSRPRDAWTAVFAQTDACVTPVLDLIEAAAHPHNRARGTFVSIDSVTQPAPAPRFSRTPSAPPRSAGAPSWAVPAGWGEPE
jgi:alpha-methylacyl-CoA racemase